MVIAQNPVEIYCFFRAWVSFFVMPVLNLLSIYPGCRKKFLQIAEKFDEVAESGN